MTVKKSYSDDKVSRVLGDFKNGKLRDSAGNVVTDRNQAVAIAMHSAGISDKSLQKSEMLAKARTLRKSIESQLKKELASDESFRKELFGYFKGNPAPVVSDVMSIAEKHGVTGNDAFSFVGKMLSDSISMIKKSEEKPDTEIKLEEPILATEEIDRREKKHKFTIVQDKNRDKKS
jgi:hypothetical protein